MMTTNQRDKNPILRQIVKWLAIGIAGIAAIIAGVVLLLLVPSVRESVFSFALSRANQMLPGHVTVARMSWPAPGSLDLRDVVWTHDADTLLSASELSVSVRLRPLVSGQIEIEHVAAKGIRGSLPAITAQFPPSEAPASGESSGGFLRAGSLPGLPSVSVERLDVMAPSFRLNEKTEIADLAIAGGLDLLADHAPVVRVEHVSVRGPVHDWSVDSLRLDLDLASGHFAGHGRGQLSPDWPLFLSVQSQSLDSVSIILTTDRGIHPPEGAGLVALAKLHRRALSIDRIGFDLTLKTPTALELSSVPALASTMEQVPEQTAITLTARGALELAPRFSAHVSSQIEANNLIRRAQVAIRYDHDILGMEALEVETDDFILTASGTLQGETITTRSTVSARALGLNVGIAARARMNDVIDVELAPVVLSDRRLEPPDPPVGVASRVRFVRRTRTLDIKDIVIEGVAGEVEISARLDSLVSGEYTASVRWPEPPELLLSALGISPLRANSLRTRWRNGAPFGFDITGELTAGESRSTVTRGSFTLPGPRTFADLLPDSARVTDLGPLEGQFLFGTRSAANGTQLDLTANLDATSWIDSSVIRVRRLPDNEITEIDTIGIAIDGLLVGVGGAIARRDYDLVGEVVVLDSSLVNRFVPAAPRIRLAAAAFLKGNLDEPALDVSLYATIEDDAYAIPTLNGRLQTTGSGAIVNLDAPEGVHTRFADMDSAAVALETLDDGRLRVSLTSAGPGVEFSQSAIIDTSDGLAIEVDAFDLVVVGRDLRSHKPFHVERRAGRITVDDLDLSGTLGTVVAGGVIGDRTDVECNIAVALPPAPPSFNIPETMWPERLDLELRAEDREVNASVNLRGFSLAHRRRSTLDLQIEGGADSVLASMTIADSSGTLFDATARLPASLSVYPPRMEMTDGPLSVDAAITRYPFAPHLFRAGLDIPEEEVARINGTIAIGGTAANPVGHGRVRVSFPDWPKISIYQLTLEASLGSPGERDGLLGQAAAVFPGISMDHIFGALSLDEDGEQVMFGVVKHPGLVSLAPTGLRIPEGANIHAALRADSLPLDRFDPFLPADMSVAGLCRIDITAEGPAGDPKLDGDIIATGLSVSVADQASVTADGNIRIAGSRVSPIVKGDIKITGGLIRIPEEQQHLHPTGGAAHLLDNVPEPTEVEPPLEQPAAIDTIVPGDTGEFDITVRIPNRFYVRGRGLDLEFAGDLHVIKKQEKPMVTGELRAIRGNFVFLGRNLKLDRGTVTFFGKEFNPSLDVVMSTRVDQVLIKILVAGTAEKPQITLESDPEMQQGDIISTLLFGASFDDLNDSQADLVERRTTEMVAALGAAQLQKNLSGVDVVSYKGADDLYLAGTLSIGKYLSPDVLLSYVYAIEDQSSSFVSLEYFLRGNFRVDTVYGRRNQTGVGFGWARDY